MQKLKVLFVLTPALHPNQGGVQMSTCKLGRWFSNLGHEVGVFSFACDGHAPVDFGKLWTSVVEGGQGEAANRDALGKVLEAFSPDVVINQMPYERGIGNFLKQRKKYLLLGCLRNTLFSVKGNLATYVQRTAPRFLRPFSGSAILQHLFLVMHRYRHRRELAWILDTYDLFVMFGPPNLDELEYFLPDFDQDRIRLIPNSIPAVLEGVPAKERRLLWLGRVSREQKQAELILPVWSKVSQALPDWRLDVVGDGPLLPELKKRAATEGLPRIEFHGRQVSDDFYRRSSIFFMTSAFEGFPNTLVEAQSYGTIPVVFNSYPVAGWIVENGRSGLLIPPFDVEGMANRIVALAKDPARGYQAECVLESAHRFHINRVGAMWQALFEAEVPRHVGSVPTGDLG